MKYSELEKMDHMEALLMLYRKIREVRPTADAMWQMFLWRSWQKPLRCR